MLKRIDTSLFTIWAVIANSLSSSRLLRSEDEQAGSTICPDCGKDEWKIFGTLHIKCAYCKAEFDNVGELRRVADRKVSLFHVN